MAESYTRSFGKKQGVLMCRYRSPVWIFTIPATSGGVFDWLLNSSKLKLPTKTVSLVQARHRSGTNQRPTLRRFSLGVMASAISLAALPAIVQEDGSDDGLGLMNISLLRMLLNAPFVFKGRCKEQDHQMMQALVAASFCLLMPFASFLLIYRQQ